MCSRSATECAPLRPAASASAVDDEEDDDDVDDDFDDDVCVVVVVVADALEGDFAGDFAGDFRDGEDAVDDGFALGTRLSDDRRVSSSLTTFSCSSNSCVSSSPICDTERFNGVVRLGLLGAETGGETAACAGLLCMVG